MGKVSLLFKFLVVLLGSLLWGVESAEGTTYWVGQSGTGNCGTASGASAPSASNRILTITAGIACLSSGDTLIIGAGTYNETIAPDTIPSGSGPGGEAAEATWSGATIIKAETPCSNVGASATGSPSCTTILRPTSPCTAVVWLMSVTHREYIIFQGFEADGNSVCIEIGRLYGQSLAAPAKNIRAQRVYWHDATGANGGGGLVEIQTNSDGSIVGRNMEMLDSTFARFAMGQNYNPNAGGNHCFYWSAHGTIRRNLIQDCYPNGNKNGTAIAIHNPEVAVDISGNDINRFGFWGIEAAHVVGTKIYNNIVRNGGGTTAECANLANTACAGIAVNGGGFTSPTNTLVANNTVYNIASGNGGSAILVVQGPFGTINTTIQNNILFGGTNDIITSYSDGGTSSNNRCSSGCATAANPQFNDAAGGNFHLTASSPTAVTQGGFNLSATFTIDKDSATRTVPWSLGAYIALNSPPNPPSNLLVHGLLLLGLFGLPMYRLIRVYVS